MNQTIDVSGLSEEAIAAVERLVAVLKKQTAPREERLPVPFASREEWWEAIRAWAESHPPSTAEVNWDRGEIYDGRGE